MWKSRDRPTINQIDHVTVGKGKMRLKHDIRSERGHICDSDHFLAQIKVKLKLIIVKSKQIHYYKRDRQLLNKKRKLTNIKKI